MHYFLHYFSLNLNYTYGVTLVQVKIERSEATRPEKERSRNCLTSFNNLQQGKEIEVQVQEGGAFSSFKQVASSFPLPTTLIV